LFFFITVKYRLTYFLINVLEKQTVRQLCYIEVVAEKKLSSAVNKLEPIIIKDDKPGKSWLIVTLAILAIISLSLLSFSVWQYNYAKQNQKTLFIR